jgi:hypothetical protein
MTTPLPAARPFVPPPLYGSHIDAGPAPGASRVIVTGSADYPHPGLVFGALTCAWRDARQPLVVAHTGRPHGIDHTAHQWVAEHALAGNTEQVLDGPDLDDTWRVLAFLDAEWTSCGLMLAAETAGLDIRRWETT